MALTEQQFVSFDARRAAIAATITKLSELKLLMDTLRPYVNPNVAWVPQGFDQDAMLDHPVPNGGGQTVREKHNALRSETIALFAAVTEIP